MLVSGSVHHRSCLPRKLRRKPQDGSGRREHLNIIVNIGIVNQRLFVGVSKPENKSNTETRTLTMDPTTDGRLEDEFLFSKGAIVRWHLSFGGVVSMVQKSEPLRVAIGDPMIWFGFINTRRSLLLDFWTIKNLAPRGWTPFPWWNAAISPGGIRHEYTSWPFFILGVPVFRTFLHCKVLWLRRSFATMRWS